MLRLRIQPLCTVTVKGDAAASMIGDLDLDGNIDSDDLTLLARYVGGIITSWDQT